MIVADRGWLHIEEVVRATASWWGEKGNHPPNLRGWWRHPHIPTRGEKARGDWPSWSVNANGGGARSLWWVWPNRTQVAVSSESSLARVLDDARV